MSAHLSLHSQAHEETPGRPKVSHPPRGATAASPSSGGTIEETPGRPKVPHPPRGATAALPSSGGTHEAAR